MLEYNIPGREKLVIENLCLDYNGTIANNGELISGVKEKILELKDKINIYVLTFMFLLLILIILLKNNVKDLGLLSRLLIKKELHYVKKKLL